MIEKFLIGIDCGTTSIRAILFDTNKNKILSTERIKTTQYFPKCGWVEQDANEIMQAVWSTLNNTITKNCLTQKNLLGIAITNQRETVVAWDKVGKPLAKAIVWQCRRTAKWIESLNCSIKNKIKRKTGLICDAYFSASKIKWLLENNTEVKKAYVDKNLHFGTIDSFVIYNLTQSHNFVTDITNASRTMLFNITTLEWDKYLLKLFKVDENLLPKVISNDTIAGKAHTIIGEIPIASVIGDQQASLFGEGCFEYGMAKNTYGTGCFILANSGNTMFSNSKMLTTIAYQLKDKTTYALEGSVFNAGSAITWLRDNMKIIDSDCKSEEMCNSIIDNAGVYFVPAFTGLGSPYWNSDCKGIITGITRSTNSIHITRAVLESMAYNTHDILKCMQTKNSLKVTELRVDGGVSANNFLMQFQSDISRMTVLKQKSPEATVLGAIYLAGLNLNIYKDLKEISHIIKFDRTFTPKASDATMQKYYKDWKKAVKKCINFN